MRPYYEHAGITIYHGDCREVLLELPKFELLCTDPPYGIRVDEERFKDNGRAKAHGDRGLSGAVACRVYEKTEWDFAAPSLEEIATLLARAQHCIIFGGNHFHLPPSRCWLVWDKQTADNAFADCELAWTNLEKPVRKISWLWNGFARAHNEVRFDHPTQKPIGVMEWCINQAPATVKTILDPYAGSGTTLVAAKNLGRSAIGIEIEERYCEIAAKRLAQEVLDFG